MSNGLTLPFQGTLDDDSICISVTSTGGGDGLSGASFGVDRVGDTGIGVFGNSDAGVGVQGGCHTGTGVAGFSDSSDGVFGQGKNGVHGQSTSPTDSGIWGNNDGGGVGVAGSSTSGTGVQGTSTSGNGVSGQTNSNLNSIHPAAGVSGNNISDGYGVQGNGGVGVYGVGTAFYGVQGIGPGGGIYGESTAGAAAGVSGLGVEFASGVFGSSVKGDGVTSLGDVHVWGNLYVSGYIINAPLADALNALFTDVQDTPPDLGGDFTIDHPLDPANKLLSHAVVSSPDMKNTYDGVVVLDANGSAAVELPAWFEALNHDYRYQLTPIEAPGPNLHIASRVNNNRFTIAGGSPHMEVCWQITGIRRDPQARAHPLMVEQDKSANEHGFYVHPQVYGQPEQKDIQWARNPEYMRLLWDFRHNPPPKPVPPRRPGDITPTV